MRCSAINPTMTIITKKINFKETQKNKKEPTNIDENKTNLDMEIEGLTLLSLIALLCSIPLYGFASGIEKGKKMTTKEKYGAGLILLGLTFSLMADFKRIKYHKEAKKCINKKV